MNKGTTMCQHGGGQRRGKQQRGAAGGGGVGGSSKTKNQTDRHPQAAVKQQASSWQEADRQTGRQAGQASTQAGGTPQRLAVTSHSSSR
jgi:hypothetical protein